MPNNFVSVLDFGADPSGTNECSDAIQEALTNHQSVHFPDGTYLVNKPLYISADYHQVTGNNRSIVRAINFTGRVIEGTTVSAVFIYSNGDKYDDISAPRKFNNSINGLRIDCNDTAEMGIFTERAPNFTAKAVIVDNAATDGIHIGTYCWGVNITDCTITSFGRSGVYLGTAANGGQIDGTRIWGNPTRGSWGVYFKDNADINGFKIAGGFIERIDSGVYIGKRTGGVHIIGNDFEDITNSAIVVNGDLSSPAGRLVGPVVFTGNLAITGGTPIDNTNGLVNSIGNRYRDNTLDFESKDQGVTNSQYDVFEGSDQYPKSGGYGSFVHQKSNIFSQSIKTSITSPPSNGKSPTNIAYLNYQFPAARTIENSSGLVFNASNHGGSPNRYLGSSYWYVSELSTSDSVNKIGTVLDMETGTPKFRPYTNGNMYLGASDFSWKALILRDQDTGTNYLVSVKSGVLTLEPFTRSAQPGQSALMTELQADEQEMERIKTATYEEESN